MKKLFSLFAFLALVILIIPAVSLLGKSNAPDKGKTNFNPELLTKEEYDKNQFYLVTDHLTNKQMKLSPLEYIKGVVASEMPLSYDSEALKAQAVAAHSYALVQLDLYDAVLSTDPSVCQGYLSPKERKLLWGENCKEYEEKLDDAVKKVIDIVMTYDKRPVLAAFHAISNGKTESAQTVWGQNISYLTPVDSKLDKSSPDYQTSSDFTPLEISKAMQTVYPEITFDKDKSKWFSEIQRSDSNTVASIKVGSIVTTGNKLRELLSLRSADFDIEEIENGFRFDVRGYGHGVGMSQYSANQMAQSGMSYKEILLHYYSGVSLEKIK